METITVHTAQNIDIDYEVGGLGERILARLIDFGIFVALTFIGLMLISFMPVTLTVYFIVIGVLLVFYDLVCEVFFNGQSVGKLIMKIRVISLDGARPKFSQYLLRWLFRLVDFLITAQLGALVASIMTDNGQRIGDIVAGTAVIRSVPRTKMNNLVFKAPAIGYVPVFEKSGQLTEMDIELIHEVIENYLKTGNSSIVHTTALRLKELLLIITPAKMNDLLFLQTLIKDYNQIAATEGVL